MPSNKPKALMLANRQLAELVCDAVNLEGINLTLPETQTLVDGITVGGHKIADQQVALNQIDAWRTLFKLVENNQFEVSIEQACYLHKIAAKEEALEWGRFRTGSVTIAGTKYLPPQAANLPDLFSKMMDDASRHEDVYDCAIHFFLTMSNYPAYAKHDHFQTLFSQHKRRFLPLK